MDYRSVFKRYEIKYILRSAQAARLKAVMRERMKEDGYGKSVICNIYLDTPDCLLARRSIERPVYKEKFRIRCYGVADENSVVFPELKKKYRSVVYKRRLAVRQSELGECYKGIFPDTQIGRELAYCFTRYPGLKPTVFLSYDREAFYAKDDDAFRMTFDRNILWRNTDLDFTSGVYGSPILDGDDVLLEVKTAGAIPLWLAAFLSDNGIYKTSFSKYGNAYTDMISVGAKREVQSA